MMGVKERMRKWHYMQEDEGREVPVGATQQEGCCVCGLVHQHTYYEKKIGRATATFQRVSSDDAGTKALRKVMLKEGDLIEVEGCNAYVVIMRKDRSKPAGVVTINGHRYKHDPEG
jgi:hypothetical protein